ncbi:ABC transporter ATP-binding protein [uncultured Tissierella sp.]|uniref:ABC transporter ATP-binding protein n=1 Tax=uncultured Tissierella sp. TaxID=448160 RepID=UPI0028062288|nr:ABC transporter ATP-binding protein [uncultured Tissierella sp.]MDU5081295.1 ABC transporter ATP-binding protein [Bacillota bacterium]
MIAVENVFAKYPGTSVNIIKDVSFEVGEGEIFGFLGPSGAGKSTLQKILTGVLPNYQGSVKVLGSEVNKHSSDFYEEIGVDFEFPNFYNKFTAMENLNYFSSLYKKQSLDPIPLLERMGLLSDANKKVGGYSKGMKMRLGFIRCLLHNPKLLFLDEPTSGLDPANARILKDIVLEQKQQGKTIILTTHNMHDAEELCDRVAFIVDGAIKALDSPQTLRKSKENTSVEFSYIKNGIDKNKNVLLSELYNDMDFMYALKSSNITKIHSKEQSLEDVFIELTGRCLL